MTTLFSCCAMFFSCKDDESSALGVDVLENSTAKLLDISSAGLTTGTGREEGEVVANWTIGKNANTNDQRQG